ncbi:hypothetical protein HDU92_007599 [Lobulomyces angularis]|nr:hypothetical protein HDU92_007599 [Lobulomyces angularis]
MQQIRLSFKLSNFDLPEQELKGLIDLLPVEEKTKVNSYRFIEDKKRALLGQLLIRISILKMLKELGFKKKKFNEIDIAMQDFCFNDLIIKRNPYGKPFLEKVQNLDSEMAEKQIFFNLSHHGDWVISCTGVDIKSLGCDVTQIEIYKNKESLFQFLDCFKDVFTEIEWKYIYQDFLLDHDNAERCKTLYKRFSQFWSLKECFIKAVGEGLSMDLDKIEFEKGKVCSDSFKDIQSDIKVRYLNKELQNWIFEITFLDDLHPVAIGTEYDTLNEVKTHCNIPFTFVSFEELLKLCNKLT